MHRLRLQELQEQEAVLQDGDRLAFLSVLAKPQVKRVSQESLVTATHIHSAVVTVRSASLRCCVSLATENPSFENTCEASWPSRVFI